MKRRLRCTFLVVLALLLAGGCDTAEQQNDFEDEAFSTPSGFTRTDENGQILSEDKDDWRTAALDPENLQRAMRCVLNRAPALVVIAHP